MKFKKRNRKNITNHINQHWKKYKKNITESYLIQLILMSEH